MIARADIARRPQSISDPPQAEKGNSMGENREIPDQELEALEDEELKDVAGGISSQTVMLIGRSGRSQEKPVIPGIPSDESRNGENSPRVKR